MLIRFLLVQRNPLDLYYFLAFFNNRYRKLKLNILNPISIFPSFREEKFHPEPEQYTELLDTSIQIRPDFRDKLIEQLKGTFGKYYDYHRRDIAANEVDYLNVEDPDVLPSCMGT